MSPAKDASLRLDIEGMSCASCVARVEKALCRVDGVQTASVNLATNSARVAFDPARVSIESIRSAVEDAGYGAAVHSGGGAEPHAAPSADHREADTAAALRRDVLLATAFTLPVMLLGMISMSPWFALQSTLSMQDADRIGFLLAIPVMFLPGRRFFTAAWKAAWHGAADMNTLVAVGSGVAFLYSALATLFPHWLGLHAGHAAVYFDTSVTIVTLILLGRWLEARARTRASSAIAELMEIQPSIAIVRRGGGEVEIPATRLVAGDEFIVKPGARVPADGIIIEGRTAIDEAVITGESLPAERTIGDEVIGGTLNQLGVVVVRATAVGGDTVFAHIIRLVDEAQSTKAPVQLLADRIASVFVPVVMLIATGAFLAWLLLFGAPFTTAMLHAIAVLIIACPCALGLATPAALMVGLGAGARMGVLIRNASVLETARRITTVVFDKTGTLTEGRPTLTQLHILDGADEQDVLCLAASVERLSEHPLARAFVDAVRERGIQPGEAGDFVYRPGLGVAAMVMGRSVLVGSAEFMEVMGVQRSADRGEEPLPSDRGAQVCIAIDGALAGIAEMSDPLRPGAAAAVAALRAMGLRTAVLSGDAPGPVNAIAASLGIDEAWPRVRPDAKAAFIGRLRDAGSVVAMVGDGVNDAPALALADVGIAMGGGSAAAMETADVTLMHADPMGVVRAIRLSRRTDARIRQNLAWAFGYNVVLIPLAAAGLLNPMVAAGAMAFSSVSVVANSLLLRKPV